ncbi:MAG: hypothetical protein M1821_008722 [Bathelium mastoideum]|nr:MAG: hypothetical protein M1821_008722 [Bathelium mastoideum]KAI9685882.1 MAG: hypothetical protein M1822_004160 [Bathelium mastoideum]
MPHATSPEEDAAVGDAIDRLLAGGQVGYDQLTALENRELEPGEKADDAMDFGDIDDDDLADDEDIAPGGADDAEEDFANGINDSSQTEAHQENGVMDGKDATADLNNLEAPKDGLADPETYSFELGDDLFGENDEPTNVDSNYDDLFGEDIAEHVDDSIPTHRSPIMSPKASTVSLVPGVEVDAPADSLETVSPTIDTQTTKSKTTESKLHLPSNEPPKTALELKLEQEQLALFQAASKKQDTHAPELPAAPVTNAEIFEVLWPRFEKDKPPRFGEILETKRAVYVGKTPPKPPKPINPTKVVLEIAPDQEKHFRVPQPSQSDPATRELEAEQKGIILTTTLANKTSERDDFIEPEVIDENEMIGGKSWADIKQLCESWDDTPSLTEDDSDDAPSGTKRPFDDQETSNPATPRKRPKTQNFDLASRLLIPNEFPSFDDPEETTRRIAEKVILDQNDPHLLLDFQQPNPAQKKVRKVGELRRVADGRVTKDHSRRYNISNDEAYNLLKENHSNKVRSTLGSMSVEHSLPAIKLQYPFYKNKLSAREARSFHRPTIAFRPGETARFTKLKSQKRKLMKGKDAQTLFQTAQDLSMADNSHSMLLEYSEENPTILSNFGMGSRLINYYRRKDMEDTARPKTDIGETQVLLPQDKSPFSIFGEIEKGESTLTLHNSMFRAPVFKHDLRPTDFVVVRNSTGIGGSQWYMRNLENVFAVGQEFPSVEVPGPHSRKVTDASKRRLRSIAYRIYMHNQQSGKNGVKLLTNEMIRPHQPDTDITSLRSKMREFMDYDKLPGTGIGTWYPKPSEPTPDTQAIRNWIKPEDICLLDSMQVGQRHLQDAGYNKGLIDMEGDDEEAADGQSMEEQLTPWQTTKNFLNACQGKAMLELYGQGDPSGRGEAFSFIKTSMKGGFKAIGESVADKIKAKNQKEHGGHAYNVAAQQRQYEEAIRQIWLAQKTSLSNEDDYSDIDPDVDGEEDMEASFVQGRTPRSEVGTPAAFARRDDETTSQFSKMSAADRQGKVLRIVRYEMDKYGKEQKHEEILRDPKVIREYLRRRKTIEVAEMKVTDLEWTGDAVADAERKKRLEAELARLERNVERRKAREQQKGIRTGDAGSPGSPAAAGGSGGGAAAPKPAGTQRKCANCGQIGHIKTNKKLCPMLNGTMKQDDSFGDSAFGPINNT